MPAKKIPAAETVYLDLRGKDLSPCDDKDLEKLEKYARILRGLIFAAVEAAQSGHPGGSSSKAEQIIALFLSGLVAFDPINPKHPGRDRVVFSAGHCTPALYGFLALIYESLRRQGRQFASAVVRPVFPEDLIRFRKADGPQGHAESYTPLVDFSTGPSGHGFSAAGGLAISHRASGLPTKVWVMMGDAESEEGLTYEARNILAANGADNIIVSLDYNHIGLDSRIEEVISSPYVNHWRGLGWNVIEADGHDICELLEAYRLARDLKNGAPTVVIAHTVKGKFYGQLENRPESHGSPINHEEYTQAIRELGFHIPGKPGAAILDIEKILESLSEADEEYIARQLEVGAQRILPEAKLIENMQSALAGRPFTDPVSIKRPKKLPPELVFKPGEKISTRAAAGAWCQWFMRQTAFFYSGAGDVSRSMPLTEADNVYGYINSENPYGRGLRFGIAEANMAMMSAGMASDVLPGGIHPVTVFGTFAVFSTMMASSVRLALVNNHFNPEHKGFFIMLAGHDGPETGEDGPTHQGLYWMSLFDAYPGIKVYKPLDANETVEMLFYALEKGEPIALSLCRAATPVLERTRGVATAAANQGAYVFKPFFGRGKKQITLAVSGPYLLRNVLLALPGLEREGLDVKIVGVTSPELFSELEKNNPAAARAVISDEDRKNIFTLHSGWKGFLNPILMTAKNKERALGIDTYLKSGAADELYEFAGFTPDDIKRKILKLC